MKTQTDMILTDLERGQTITPLDALNNYGCMRLASRVHELKKDGFDVRKKTIIRDGKSYAAYYIPVADKFELTYC
jgi:hypothetical protein